MTKTFEVWSAGSPHTRESLIQHVYTLEEAQAVKLVWETFRYSTGDSFKAYILEIVKTRLEP